MNNKEDLNKKSFEMKFNSKSRTSYQEDKNKYDIFVNELDFDTFNIDLDIDIPDIDLGDLDEIVTLGVKPKVSFFTYLKNAIKELGLRNIFHDKSELLIITIVGAIILAFTIFNSSSENIGNLYSLVFGGAPLIYLGVVLFSFYNSKLKGVLELEMTCKYNLYQLSALRMFIFSIGSVFINTMIILIAAYYNKDINSIRTIIISITGLFLFSSIFLYSLINFKGLFMKIGIVVLWVIGNLLLSVGNNEYYIVFFDKVPIYIHLIISIICIVFYVKNLNNLISYRWKRRGEILC